MISTRDTKHATSTHITTSGGLISAAFIENIREMGARQRGVEPESFALTTTPAPKNPAALEQSIAAAWELLLERWDAVRDDLPLMDVSQVRARWLLPLFELLDFDPLYLRGQLDALYAHLYGLTRDELAYILDTFPIVRRKDEARWGEYRTKRLVLENFETLRDQFKDEIRPGKKSCI